MENQSFRPEFFLFEKQFAGKPLFSSRQALIFELVSTKTSSYYVDPSVNQEDYLKTFNKLKSFLSQVLSGTTKRNINEEFRDSLYEVLKTKPIPQNLLEQYFSETILSFSKIKRIAPVKKATYNFDECWDKLLEEFDESGYTVFISARPYELENDPNEFFTELREITIKDLANNLITPSFKKYRYNIPSKEVGKILWRRIHTLLCKYFHSREDFHDILKKLKASYLIESHDEPEELQIRRLVSGFLRQINKDGILWMFVNTAPIYVCSQIHFNPNQPYNSS
ncbi:MAG TPA: hypothetical protein VHZ50_12020, partial [Puia sp.]|nr:hypothetical protein [Puia sp.]